MSFLHHIFISILLVFTLSGAKQINIQNETNWKLKLEQVVKELSKRNSGKHSLLTTIPVNRTYIGGMSKSCSRNTFADGQKAYVKEIFIKKNKTTDIWANDRLYVDIYECKNNYEASVLEAKLDSFAEYRYKGKVTGCNSDDHTSEYPNGCCDVIFARGSYIKFLYQNVIIVLVDDSGSNPIFRNIKNDFKEYFVK